MEKIGFIGAYDKANFMIYLAKVLSLLGYKVLVVDTTSIQKMKYIIPTINPTKSYITNFEEVDFAIGFEKWEEVEKYLGLKYDSNDEKVKENKSTYDYVLIDIDSREKIESFGIQSLEKNYFVTSFDMFSLKKGMDIFQNLSVPIKLTKLLFSYETSKEDEKYLNFISMGHKIVWNEYTIYFQILGENNRVFEENQRFEKIRFKRLSINFRDSLAYVAQDICKNENMGRIKKAMKE